MTSVFAEMLAPLAARMGRVVRAHEVLRVTGVLEGADPAAAERTARAAVLEWAAEQAGTRLPPEAARGETFDLPLPGRDPSAVRLRMTETELWAFRIHRPDRDVPGRAWTTEVVLERAPGRPVRFAAKLSAATEEPELVIAPAVPGFVVRIATAPGLRAGTQVATPVPVEVQGEDAGDLIDRLCDPGRLLPVLAVSVPAGAAVRHTDAGALARRLAGLAHVMLIHPEASWELTGRLGKKLSVYEGAVRLYRAGFGPDADPYAHPLVLAHRLADPASAKIALRGLSENVAQASLRGSRLGPEVPGFAAIRAAALEQHSRSLGAAVSLAEQLQAAQARIAALEAQVAALEQETDYSIAEAEGERARAEAAEARAHGANWRVLDLAERMRLKGEDQDDGVDLPQDWADVAEWCDRHLAGRLALAPAARRMLRDPPLYGAPEIAARCLLWLAGAARDRFIGGGGSLSNVAILPGIENAPCGADTFTFGFEGARLEADWHVKSGGNTHDPVRCLRIYYAFDPHSGQIVVAEMPAHRRTGAT